MTGNEYEFTEQYFSAFFDNAAPVKVGSVLKDCGDGMWQLFEPDGITKVEARYSKGFINDNASIIKERAHD